MSDEHIKYNIKIDVDYNDADTMTSHHIINEAELKLVKLVIEKIKKFKPYKATFISGFDGKEDEITHSNNFPVGDCIDKDTNEKSAVELYDRGDNEKPSVEFMLFCKLLPRYEDEFFLHTILSIYISPASPQIKIF